MRPIPEVIRKTVLLIKLAFAERIEMVDRVIGDEAIQVKSTFLTDGVAAEEPAGLRIVPPERGCAEDLCQEYQAEKVADGPHLRDCYAYANCL